MIGIMGAVLIALGAVGLAIGAVNVVRLNKELGR